MKEKEIERNMTDKIHEETFKWIAIVHPKMKIQNHVVPKLCDLLFPVEHKIYFIYFKECANCDFSVQLQ